ncbi:uncharacterized protein LOC132543032 [Ylistrum balloti]|uniref:uncharacterized protein LOC132543032 n=1 Tax=Ylistrum balloti TaxID=509963 RepID=UPI002905D28F|nr:uncharacterized protein LOC132543032 [Ylistrum balloti]
MDGRHFAYVLEKYMENNRRKILEEKMRLAKKKYAEEKDDPTVILALDIKKIWKSLEEFSIPSDAWRRVEDFALPSAYRACTKVKGKMILMDSISAREASKLSSVFDEFRTVIQYITGVYMDVSANIAEDPEQAEKYYQKTCVAITTLWSACVRLTVDCVITLKQNWGCTDEYMELSKKISSTCAMCVKMITVTNDVIKFPVPDAQKDAFLECAVDKSTEVCSSLSKLIDAVKPNEEGPADAMMEMVTWSLFSLNHVSCFVIKPLLANGHVESKWFKQYSETLSKMFDKLQGVTEETSTGLDMQAREETPPPPQPESETEPEVKEEVKGKEKKNEVNKKGVKKGKEAEDPQEPEQEVPPPPPPPQTPEILTSLDQQYAKFSEDVISAGKVTICIEDTSDLNARLFYRPEVHKELAKCRFGACDMKDRVQWLEEINLTPDQTLVSDIYVISDGILMTTVDVEVEITAIPPKGSASRIIVKIRKGGVWSILEKYDKEVLPEHVQVSFKTNELEAVYAYVEEPSDEEEIVPEGCTFKSPTNSKVFINFPHGAVQDPTKVLVKFVSAESAEQNVNERPSSKDKASSGILGILAVSDAVEVSAKDSSVDIQKNILVQLTIDGDDSDDGKDTHLVVIRYKDDQVQVMDKSQCHITQVEHGVYSVQTRGLWCIGLARIKKIFLNMRDTLKKEFLVMFGKVKLCNLCTFIDNTLRDKDRGLTTFWIEILEKCRVPEATSEHAQHNLIEVKSSRSKDLIIRQSETLIIQLDGQIRVVGAPLRDKYTLTYLENTDNHLQVPLEIKRDQDKPPNATFTFKDATSGQTCHTVSVPIRDLTELPTDEITSRPPTKYHDKDNSREELKHRDEAAKNVLSHSSLMCMARELSHAECKRLGTQMGVSMETMEKFSTACDREPTNTNFRILCEWRGKSVRSSMVDFLINSLRTTGLCSQAAVVEKVSKLCRGIHQEDFNN